MYNLYLLHLVTLCYCLFQHVRWRSHHVARNWSHWSLPLTAWLSEGLRGRTENEEACLCMPGTLHAPAACPKAVCWKMLEIVWFCYVLLIEGALALLLLLVYPNQIQSFLERERGIHIYIYMILWNGVGSSTQILLNYSYVLVHQQLNTCRFFLGGSSPPSTRTRRRHCQRKQRKQSKDDPGGFLLGHE